MESTSDRVVRFLIEHARCNDCGAEYRVEDVHILSQTAERIWDLAAVCHSCYGLSLRRAIVKPGADEPKARYEMRRLDELTTAERRRFQGLPSLERDDVLDMAQFLEGFDGDFRGLFSSESDEP